MACWIPISLTRGCRAHSLKVYTTCAVRNKAHKSPISSIISHVAFAEVNTFCEGINECTRATVVSSVGLSSRRVTRVLQRSTDWHAVCSREIFTISWISAIIPSAWASLSIWVIGRPAPEGKQEERCRPAWLTEQRAPIDWEGLPVTSWICEDVNDVCCM